MASAQRVEISAGAGWCVSAGALDPIPGAVPSTDAQALCPVGGDAPVLFPAGVGAVLPDGPL